MLVIAIIVAGLIALSWATAQRSDVEDVAANNKPSDDDSEQSNELELSRSMNIGHTHEIVRETDRAKLADPQPKQIHIQYLDHFHIRLMLDQAEKKKSSAKKNTSKRRRRRRDDEILREMFGDQLREEPEPFSQERQRERSRECGLER